MVASTCPPTPRQSGGGQESRAFTRVGLTVVRSIEEHRNRSLSRRLEVMRIVRSLVIEVSPRGQCHP